MDDSEFEVGDVVKFGPNCSPSGKYSSKRGYLFVVEPSSPKLLACRCISTGEAGPVGYIPGTLYFGPPSYFVQCSVKDKFRGRGSCG